MGFHRGGGIRAYIVNAMEKVKHTKVARFVDKLAVSSEPGLTNAQLMLTNHDLKPGKFEEAHVLSFELNSIRS